MTDEKRQKMIEVLGLVMEDAESDALSLDGQPFTGKTVATQFGHVFASIKTLAEIVKDILEEKTV